MTPEQEYQARLLARAVLAEDHVGLGVTLNLDHSTQARAEVSIRLEGMVSTIIEHIFLNHAALATMVSDKVKQAASTISIETEVEKAVAVELSKLQHTIEVMIRAEIQRAVANAVYASLGGFPNAIARAASEKVWSAVNKVLDKIEEQ